MTAERPLVGDVMSREVLTLTEDQDLEHLEHAMRMFKFRHMPVTQNRRLVGLVSHRDLLGVSASTLLPSAAEQNALLARRFHVRDVMVREVDTVRADVPLADAARAMLQKQLGCLPVVDADNVLVGIITETDFLRLAVRSLEERAGGG
ncbi:MAG: CBS domain-containing protein [Deltaproteobacteria bacterium]|nr:CBS domain-containing protein [Deltaproteobacteria bacterium]